jgi:hypothetical protein
MGPDQVVRQLVSESKSQEASVLMTMTLMEHAFLEDGEWDRPPWLYMLYRTMPPTDMAEMLATAGGGVQMMAVQPLGTLPADTSDIMTGAMRGFAGHLRGINQFADIRPALGPNMVAWVLVNEAWAVESESAGPIDPELQRQAEAHVLKQRPDRQEVRQLIGVDRTGIRYQVTRVRNGATFAVIDEAPVPDQQIIDGTVSMQNKLGGSMFTALQELMESTP